MNTEHTTENDYTRETKIIVESRRIEWVAVMGPVACKCGHEHYGRKDTTKPTLAPQWRFCEDAACKCYALRPSESSTSPG